MKRIDPDERQEPMRLLRMVARHLVEYRGDILLHWCVPSLLQQIDQHIFVRTNLGREPHCRACVAVNVVGAPAGKSFASECLDEVGEMPEILLWIGPRPTRRGIRAERQYHHSDNRCFIGCCSDLDYWFCHGLPPRGKPPDALRIPTSQVTGIILDFTSQSMTVQEFLAVRAP